MTRRNRGSRDQPCATAAPMSNLRVVVDEPRPGETWNRRLQFSVNYGRDYLGDEERCVRPYGNPAGLLVLCFTNPQIQAVSVQRIDLVSPRGAFAVDRPADAMRIDRRIES